MNRTHCNGVSEVDVEAKKTADRSEAQREAEDGGYELSRAHIEKCVHCKDIALGE